MATALIPHSPLADAKLLPGADYRCRMPRLDQSFPVAGQGTSCHLPSHDYSRQLLAKLGRFWEDKLFCDLTLRVHNVSFRVSLITSLILTLTINPCIHMIITSLVKN